MATTNNVTRKTLASQIDRLDTILDGLADNLNDAVAMAAGGAVKEVVSVAVQEAVHSALVEILTNAEVQKRLGSQAASVQETVPLLFRLAAKARSCWNWLAGAAKSAWTKVTTMAKAYCGKVKETAQTIITAAGTTEFVSISYDLWPVNFVPLPCGGGSRGKPVQKPTEVGTT